MKLKTNALHVYKTSMLILVVLQFIMVNQATAMGQDALRQLVVNARSARGVTASPVIPVIPTATTAPAGTNQPAGIAANTAIPTVNIAQPATQTANPAQPVAAAIPVATSIATVNNVQPAGTPTAITQAPQATTIPVAATAVAPLLSTTVNSVPAPGAAPAMTNNPLSVEAPAVATAINATPVVSANTQQNLAIPIPNQNQLLPTPIPQSTSTIAVNAPQTIQAITPVQTVPATAAAIPVAAPTAPAAVPNATTAQVSVLGAQANNIQHQIVIPATTPQAIPVEINTEEQSSSALMPIASASATTVTAPSIPTNNEANTVIPQILPVATQQIATTAAPVISPNIASATQNAMTIPTNQNIQQATTQFSIPTVSVPSTATPTQVTQANTNQSSLNDRIKHLYSMMDDAQGKVFDAQTYANFGASLVETFNEAVETQSYMIQLLTAASSTPLLNPDQHNYVRQVMIPNLDQIDEDTKPIPADRKSVV